MAALQYNHVDLTYDQLPIALASADLCWPLRELTPHIVRIKVPTKEGSWIRLQINTDSEHLRKFSALDWPADDESSEPNGQITALHHPPETYALPARLAISRWYCPDRNHVLIVGNDFYGNVK